MRIIFIHSLMVSAFFFSLSIPAYAANECRVQYGWNTGNSFQGTFKNKLAFVYLNKGQVKFFNRNRMNFVKNLKNNPIKIFLTNVVASPLILNKNQRNPAAGMYSAVPKLVKIQCINNTNATNSGSSSASSATASILVSNLLSLGKSANFIAGQLVANFNLNAQAIANLFKQSNINVEQTTLVLKNRFRMSRVNARQILRNANYRMSLLMAALNKYYGVVRSTTNKVKTKFTQGRRQVQNMTTANDFSVSVVEAAAKELKGWFIFSEISRSRCKVNGEAALAGPGVFRSSYRWKSHVKRELMKKGVPKRVALKWDAAFKFSFDDWAKKVTIPGLPWYPLFASFPGPIVPQTLNVPTPLAALISQGLLSMSPNGLKKKIVSETRSRRYMREITMFSMQLSARFTKFLAVAPVVNVKGFGNVPSFKVNRRPGPVIGGGCFGRGVVASSVNEL